MEWEWLLAAVIITVPVVLFGAIELLAYRRRRRDKLIARRAKGPPRSNSSRRQAN